MLTGAILKPIEEIQKMLFTHTIGGVPAINLVPLNSIQEGKFYLSSGQTAVAYRDRQVDVIVIYKLGTGQVEIYENDDQYELKENNPDCAMFFSHEVVNVSMHFEIMGGTK